MSRLSGRVAIVTGGGRGLGRAHAHHLAEQGARVVVNDLGSSLGGDGKDALHAQEVVDEIVAAGGEAIASAHDVAEWGDAEALVSIAVETYGALHVLVNNAGILRDRTLANLSESEWDDVIRVHLKGHAAPTRHAMAYWRQRSKDGHSVKASVVNTTSVAGFCGNFGQANYSSAKAAVVALARVTALEGASFGVRANAVSPSARTRLTLAVPGSEERLREPNRDDSFDYYAPGNISPLIAWLAEEDCPANGQVFHLGGNRLFVLAIPTIAHLLETEGRWTAGELDRQLGSKLVENLQVESFISV